MNQDHESPNREEVIELVSKSIDEKLTEEQAKRLDQLLASDPAARQLYIELTHLNACLHFEGERLLEPSIFDDPVPVCNSPTLRREKWMANPWLFRGLAVVASAMFVLLGYYISDLKYAVEPELDVAATIVETRNCSWGAGVLPTENGSKLTEGHLNLVTGIAKLRFSSGAEVVLESPAEFEIVDSMRCVLKNGTLVANVPESAHGFVVDTDAAQLIDRGTSFGVSVNRDAKSTKVDVFDGIVDVQHRKSKKQKRMTEGERSHIDPESFEVFSSANLEDSVGDVSDESEEEKIVTITSGDGRGKDSFIHGFKPDNRRFAKMLLVTNNGKVGRGCKAYIGFDLGKLNGQGIANAKLQLQIQRYIGSGFASLVPDSTFAVYGITEDIPEWHEKKLTWNNAAANKQGSAEVDPEMTKLLGRFEILQGRSEGFVSIEGEPLAEFLTAKKGKLATLIVVRETPQRNSGGIYHAFAGRRTPEASPPTLIVDIE